MDEPRSSGQRSTVALGVVLLVLGGLALLGRALSIDVFGVGWPIIIIAAGVGLFVAAIAVGDTPGLAFAIPGGIVTMLGVVLAVQWTTGLWATWAYAWALVAPGGVGLGFVAYGLVTGRLDLARGGMPILMTGLGLFLAFGLFFEGVLHLNGDRLPDAQPILAAGLLALGALMLAWGFVRRSPDR